MWKASSLLIASVLILAVLGIVMLASTSGVQAAERFNDPNFFLKKQLVWLVIAVVVGFLTFRFLDYHYLRTFPIPLAVITLVLLGLVFVPGLGLTVKGSTRWLNFGVANFQPSELAKLGVIVWLSWWMSRYQRWAGTFCRGVLIPLLYPIIVIIMLMLEPDYGSTFLIAIVSFFIVFLGGARWSYLSILSVIGSLGFILLVMQDNVRRRRIMAFLNPEQYADKEGYQVLQSTYAFITGGARGLGLGESVQKRFYLPEAHTDFIFAIVGEELGIGGTLLLLLLYFVIFCCGLYISFRASDLFGKLLGFGITLIFTFQAILNMGVVTGCLPTKGIPLPLISFGGSSLLITFAMIGILLNIGAQAQLDRDEKRNASIKDVMHSM